MATLVIVAGPNGSGKTTLVRSGELALALAVPPISVNADDIARAIAPGRQPTDDESLRAALIADALVDEMIVAGKSFAVETVLSSEKYKSRVQTAKAAGFEVVLIYVAVRSQDLNVARVASRVMLGGHTVPVDRIRARRLRSFQMFGWFARFADKVLVFDNSGAAPRLAAVKGPPGWMNRYLAGAQGGTWMLLAPDLLPPELSSILRIVAAETADPGA